MPLRARLYVRKKDVPQLAKAYPWDFRTKLELAAELVGWLTEWLGQTGKALWLVADGAYAKRPFLKPVLALGVVVFSRLRQDAHLCSLPPTKRRQGQRGPLPTYGQERIDLAKRAGPKRGWQPVECVPYGARVSKTIKTFLATWRPAGGVIRVVIVREDDGWLAYFCSDPALSAVAILEAMADRGAIEQTFQDVKEVWGAGQQQVTNVYASIGAFAVNLTMYSVVEAWAWERAEEELVDRSRSPWDTEERRPSHADKRKALQREILRAEIQAASRGGGRVGGVSPPRHAAARLGRLTHTSLRKVQSRRKPCSRGSEPWRNRAPHYARSYPSPGLVQKPASPASGRAAFRCSSVRTVETAIYKVIGAVIAPNLDQLTAEAREEYAPFDIIEAFRIPSGASASREELSLQPLVILDDAHVLHPDQYEQVKRWLAGRELRLARWMLARFDALKPEEALAEDGERP